MTYVDRLAEVTGETVHGWYDWLVKEQCGCCSVVFARDAKWNWVVCMGWHSEGDGKWQVAWKIGRESPRNAMQTDLDLDFEMPYDPETGDVDDTLEVLGSPPKTKAKWNALARAMRDRAVRTYGRWKEEEEDAQDTVS